MHGALLRLNWKSASARACPCLARLVPSVRQPSMSAIKGLLMNRATAALSLLLFLAACEKEPDFDQRYDHIGNELAQKVNAIENEMAAQQQEGGQQRTEEQTSEPTYLHR